MKLSEVEEALTSYMRLHGYSRESIENYVSVVRAFGSWLVKRPEMAKLSRKDRVEKYLSWIVESRDVSPSTQNVHLSALLLMHKVIFDEQLTGIDAVRARRRDRIPPILSREQVVALIGGLPEQYQLMARVMYGTGVRIKECLSIRLKDVDFEQEKIVVHEGKGDKDRVVPMPETLVAALRSQLDAARKQWEFDRTHKFNGVHVPNALAVKYPKAPTSSDWYWLFPNPNLGKEPESGKLLRHHVYPFAVEKAFVETRRRLKLPEYTTPHVLRHACFTHIAQRMMMQAIPEKMIKAHLRDLAGHITEDTINTYLHMAAPRNAIVKSPLDELD